MFLFNNKGFFGLHNTELKTRLSKTETANYPGWKKEHSRMQGRYQGYQIFNKLPEMCRGEKRIGTFKKQMTAHIIERHIWGCKVKYKDKAECKDIERNIQPWNVAHVNLASGI